MNDNDIPLDGDRAIDVMFCVNRQVLPGLLVAAFSVLKHVSDNARVCRFTVFSDDLLESDIELLNSTLSRSGKRFTITSTTLDPKCFESFPTLNGNHAAYFRLVAAEQMDAERVLYLDADILCLTDIFPMFSLDMQGKPLGWVAESPLSGCIDTAVAKTLAATDETNYFNSGVLLINLPEWSRVNVSERAIEYVGEVSPEFHDQSALNVVTQGLSLRLDDRFNTLANSRQKWRHLITKYPEIDRLIHFVDYPKPWSPLGWLVHPQYTLWQTAAKEAGVRVSDVVPGRRNSLIHVFSKWKNYKKAAKDRLLFMMLRHGLIKRVKGDELEGNGSLA